MTPRPTHPDDIKPPGGGIKQTFVASRFGWRVHTTHNCFILELAPFRFTRAGIERKAQRIVRSLERRERASTFERSYAPQPTRPSPMQGETAKCPPAPGAAPDGLGHRERTPR